MQDENNDIDEVAEGEQLYERLVLEVSAGQEPLRIDKFLMSRIEGATRNKIQQAILNEMVYVNDKPVKPNYKIKPSDKIVVFESRNPDISEIIPENILSKAPSAELRPGQKDSDSLPEYDLLDQILFQYIECQKGPDEIINQGFDELLVQRILKMVNTNEYKRFQFGPILRVSSKAFGRGRRMPLVAKYLG